MTIEMPSLLSVVAAAHARGEEVWESSDARVIRVYGGANNVLYRVESGEEKYACKLCLADERRRAAREYSALRLLQDAGLDLAPNPLWFDATYQIVPFPAVVYSWLDGIMLEEVPTDQQLTSLIEGYQYLHSLPRQEYVHYNLPEAWFHWFDYQPYLSELDSFLARYGSWFSAVSPEGRKLYPRLEKLVQQCKLHLHSTQNPSPSRYDIHIGMCRVDPNLANCLWGTDHKIRWVDWEYSGWGDPALELADIRWHASWMGLSSEKHQMLRSLYTPHKEDINFYERLEIWDRIVSTRWPFLILRSMWNSSGGTDRSQKGSPAEENKDLQLRLLQTIERAEHFGTEDSSS
jgi:aminoglycoside phosphotransferase (APT) family kinase protein